jgi:hypothetical protein
LAKRNPGCYGEIGDRALSRLPRDASKLASGFERQADILLRQRRLSGVGAAQIIEQPSMRDQPWTAGQGGRGVGGDATLPGLGELTVRLLLLGHQLKTQMVVGVIGVVMTVMVGVVTVVMMVMTMMIAVPSCGWNRAADCDCADNAQCRSNCR